MVRLVDVLVQAWVVLETVNPVDARVSEDEEEGNGEEGVGQSHV